MKYQIDQSGKIEETAQDTLLAISNDKKYTVLLSAKTKRTLQAIFRLEGRQRVFVYLTFSALLFILLKEVKPLSKVIIDKEYPGRENLIRLMIYEIAKQEQWVDKLRFEFGLVGKSSPVHGLAHKTFTKKLKVNKKVKLEEIIKLIFPNKKDRVSRY